MESHFVYFYDPIAKLLYRGDGNVVDAQAKGEDVEIVSQSAGDNFDPERVAVARDGSIYFSGYYGNGLRKVAPDGSTVQVTLHAFHSDDPNNISAFDGQLAATVQPNATIEDLMAAPDGSIYLAFHHTIYRLDSDERSYVVLGGANFDVPAPDGTLATQAYRTNRGGLARISIGKDSSIYYWENQANPDGSGNGLDSVRKIAPDGKIYTIAGLGGSNIPDNGVYNEFPDAGSSALHARMYALADIAVGPEDSICYAQSSSYGGVARIDTDGA